MYIQAGMQAGQFKPVVDRILAVKQIVEVHHYMEFNQQMGRTVVTL
jgi:NADPH:quinone reductase-like Zn-dependent oxidoreductase